MAPESELTEDARDELEALCAILPENALPSLDPERMLSTSGESNASLSLVVFPEEEHEQQSSGVPVRVTLSLSLASPYPSSSPGSLAVHPVSGISDAACASLSEKLAHAASERAGTPMLLDLFELARDELRSVAGMANETPAAPESPEERAAREEIEAEERLEQERATGTEVTYERLANLLAQLDQELEADRAQYLSMDSRPTGKDIFQKQHQHRERQEADSGEGQVELDGEGNGERER